MGCTLKPDGKRALEVARAAGQAEARKSVFWVYKLKERCLARQISNFHVCTSFAERSMGGE